MTAAAMAIAAVSLGVQNKALNDELNGESMLVKNLAGQASKAQQVLEVLTAPSAQRVTLTEGKAPPEPSARATYLPDRGALILLATNLKPLPEGKAYELWVIPASGKAPVPAGVFRPDSVGTATLVLPPLPAGIAAKAFGVTIEKASGADSPTIADHPVGSDGKLIKAPKASRGSGVVRKHLTAHFSGCRKVSAARHDCTGWPQTLPTRHDRTGWPQSLTKGTGSAVPLNTMPTTALAAEVRFSRPQSDDRSF